MKTFSILFLLFCMAGVLKAQSIIGRWQLIKHTSCLDDKVDVGDDSVQDVMDDMKSMSQRTAQVVQFKENQSGEESTAILYKSKTTNSKTFLYKFDGTNLYILDKKSHTLTESYTVDSM